MAYSSRTGFSLEPRVGYFPAQQTYLCSWADYTLHRDNGPRGLSVSNLASALPVKPCTLGHTHLHRGAPLTKLSAHREHLFLNCTKAFQGPVVGTAQDHSCNSVSFILLKVLLKTEVILY